jgi:hypothetical protein
MSGQSNARVPLSVLVPVKNEAVNPVDCLASVSFAQEVVVVDSASTDGYASSGRSSWNSGRARKRWLKKLAMRAPFRPSLRFVYHYIWKQGFRDVWLLYRLLAWYERMIVLKERELKDRPSNSSAVS